MRRISSRGLTGFTKLGKEFIFNWCEVGQTLLDISWSRDDIKPFTSMQELFSKPDAIENLQGTFCANTQGIFQGNLLISDIWGVLKKETRFLPNELKHYKEL